MAGTSKDDRTGPYDQIYRRIIEGVYRPGERLIEQRIAEELAVSRTPVREALVRLEGAGLVVNARHKGAMVRALTREDIVDLYELRATLESLAAKRAATRADEAEIARMDEAIDAFDAAVAGPWPATIDQLRELNAANRQFHETVLTAARHPLLGQQLSVTVDAPLVFQAFRRFDRSESERSNLFHRLLRNAIQAHDGERAARLMTEHIDQGRDVLLVGFDRVGSVEGLFDAEPGALSLGVSAPG
jgi:DNA-binding GntR family transcriptional regulator